MSYKIIVAMSNQRGIGKDGSLPWNIKEDLKFFSKLTKGNNNNAIIMGKNTWVGLKKHLPNRDNLILSSSLSIHEEHDDNIVKSFTSIEEVNKFCESKNYDDVWVIGGAQIYKQFIDKNLCKQCIITYINNVYDCDTFFPQLDNEWKITSMLPMETETDLNILVWNVEKV
tara:strand:+ start:5406 stop:5915 length:510 start_codon:yes stop_codon:yes gene_type:complete